MQTLWIDGTICIFELIIEYGMKNMDHIILQNNVKTQRKTECLADFHNNSNRLSDCTLCPRECHVNRLKGQRGRCHETAEIVVARAALHMWEEPCVSGSAGSGAVFFSGGCL